MTPTASPEPPIRLRTPRDVLATVPRLLGYRPRRSIVFLNLHDGNGVSTMRVDLPEPAPEEVEKGRIAALAGMLCKVPDIRQTLIAVYAEGPFDQGGDVPRASFIRPLIGRILDSGFRVHDALCVADDAWGAYDGHDAGIPHPLDELVEPAPGDDDPVPIAAGVEELASLPEVGFFARRGFAASLARQREREHGEFASPVEAAEAALALEPERASSDELAAVLWLLLCPECRDAALYTWAWGPERGAELLVESDRIAAGEVGPEDDSIALDLMGMGHAGRPDGERIRRGIRLVSRLAALAPEGAAPEALAVLAWLHWSQGSGSIAGRFVDRARAIDPDFGFAELLAAVLGQGRLPEWAYRRPEE
ncbi:MAG TPA: DUF4192 family protein [Gryllotalpicola sp.]